MALDIEDYGLIGDCETAALVGRNGSIDWLCVPRFDSPACFAALLGTRQHGRWSIAPTEAVVDCRRGYRGETLILETELTTTSGTVRLIDFMPLRRNTPDVVRIVEGVSGEVRLHLDLVIRFGYGSVAPWLKRTDQGVVAIAGPDMLRLMTPVAVEEQGPALVADLCVSAGQRIPFVLSWMLPYDVAAAIDPELALIETERWWSEWSQRSHYRGPWRDAVQRSLITLKALTYAPSGGIVAAPTTSLPEWIGGVRNWDYRYCWLRDATFTLYALLTAGHTEEAAAWREWLLRAVAGSAADMQIMYGISGERTLTEREIDWLPGYRGSLPVRIGNGAHRQHQLDVYGELMDVLHQLRRRGLPSDPDAWRMQRALLDYLTDDWRSPDEGIWEVRGPRRQFTHSKVMAWVAMDRGVKAVEQFGLEGPVERWRKARDEIHATVCAQGFDSSIPSFVQSFGSTALDASLLMIPLVGFLPETDPRVRATVTAIERHLMRDGLVERYRNQTAIDGLPPGEGVFLPCSFWLADNLDLLGRHDDAVELFERLLALRNDLGLLSEEYDPSARRQLGNFPQAFSHVGLINTAHNLSRGRGPARERKES